MRPLRLLWRLLVAAFASLLFWTAVHHLLPATKETEEDTDAGWVPVQAQDRPPGLTPFLSRVYRDVVSNVQSETNNLFLGANQRRQVGISVAINQSINQSINQLLNQLIG